MAIIKDFDEFQGEKYGEMFELVDKLIHIMAPDVDNPEKDYDYVKCEIVDELMYTAESMLVDEGFSTCFPSRTFEEEIPCFLSEARCEHCQYTDEEGRTKITQKVEDGEVVEPEHPVIEFDENGKPKLTVIQGGIHG